MKLIKMKCENCGAQLEVNKDLDKIICNFCGAENLIDDDAAELRRVEDVKLQARKQNHEQSLKERQETLEQDLKEREILNKANAKEKFKKSKFSKVLLVFFAIAVLLFFTGSGFLVKALTLIQAVLFIGAWLMGMEIIKEPIKGLKIILAILAFVLIIPIVNTGGDTTTKEKYENINWDYIILKEELPKPSGTKGKIITNSDEHLSMYISVKSEDEYREYIEQCKNLGYTVDEKNNTSSYEAKNEDGYKLRIWYSSSNKEYNISLDAEEYSSNNTIAPSDEQSNNDSNNDNNNSTELRSDFKKAMDSYETFMDEYIAFMTKYKNNDGSDFELLKDYGTFMKKYTEAVLEFDKWEDSNLNDEEARYYLEVQMRVNRKLAEAALN